MKRYFLAAVFLLAISPAAAQVLPNVNLVFEPLRANSIYKVVERAGWNIHALLGAGYTVPMPGSDSNNITLQQEGGYFIRSRKALESLRKTGSFAPNENWSKR